MEKQKGDSVGMYRNLVHVVAMRVGEEGERLLRQYGELVIQYHGLPSEKKEEFKEQKIMPMLDKIGEAEKVDHRIGEATVKVVFAESLLH